jgi:hypothetical protein
LEIGSVTLLVESRRKAKLQNLVTVIASSGRKEKVKIHNKVMTIEENMITTQK